MRKGNGEELGVRVEKREKRLAGRDGERITGGDARQGQPPSPVPSPERTNSRQEGALGGGSLPGDLGVGGGQR